MASQTVENYIKAIFQISEKEGGMVSTSDLALHLGTTAASVTDMLKKLADQKAILYQRYKGVNLTHDGNAMAIQLIRKHRLWETFLHSKLDISWDEVHEIAEELEHVKSKILIDKLDQFLGNPKFDPHGDPIPDSHGKFTLRSQQPLNQVSIGQTVKMVGVKDHDQSFLKYLDSIPLALDHTITVKECIDFDKSMVIQINHLNEHTISSKVSENILVKL